MTSRAPSPYFASAAPGLERLCAAELKQLQVDARLTQGGVEFGGSLRDLYRANLHLRCASRVLVRLGTYYAATFSELRSKASRLKWENYLKPGQPVRIRAACHKSKLYHSGAVAERVAAAIADRLKTPVDAQAGSDDDESDGAQVVLVRLVRDMCTISIDSSGNLLHQRGYRLATAKAPLRETLAAGLLLAARWDLAGPLLDPFCGAGSIAIEAALMAHHIAPGRQRRFGFMEWPSFDEALWRAVLNKAHEAAGETRPGPAIIASDRDAGAIEAAQANAARAGVADKIEFARRPVSELTAPPGPGWVVTNPPYGLRVGGGDIRNLYARFGQVLQQHCAGWQVAMVTADLQLAQSTGLRFDRGRSLKLVNGGLPVSLEQARVAPPGGSPGGSPEGSPDA